MSDDIRILVAEAMGWNFQHPNDLCTGPDGNLYSSLPAYTTSADAALTLCDQLKSEGWRYLVFNLDDGKVGCVLFKTENSSWDAPLIADSLPMALCLAFLKTRTIADAVMQPEGAQ